MSRRTKAVSVDSRTRSSVRQRDRFCIFCGRQGSDMMHYIPRSSGGLGIVQNLALGCRQCHVNLDFTDKRKEMLEHFKRHLDKHYPDFPDSERKFKKWSPIDD